MPTRRFGTSPPIVREGSLPPRPPQSTFEWFLGVAPRSLPRPSRLLAAVCMFDFTACIWLWTSSNTGTGDLALLVSFRVSLLGFSVVAAHLLLKVFLPCNEKDLEAACEKENEGECKQPNGFAHSMLDHTPLEQDVDLKRRAAKVIVYNRFPH